MSAPTGTLELHVGGAPITLRPRRLVVAGYTGRDESAVRAHIAELAAEGIAPPPRVPMLYDLDPGLVTTATAVTVGGSWTSGEAEPVLIRHAGRWYLGVGSDHTDRDLERADVARSKAACPKPVGPGLVALPSDVARGGFDGSWDAIAVRSTVDGTPYQEGTLAALRPPSDLLGVLADGLADDNPVDDLVVLGGTVPLLTGSFRFGTTWTVALTGPGLDLSHTYTTS
jgi:hypothetical protein